MLESLVLVRSFMHSYVVSYHVKASSEELTCLRRRGHTPSPKQHSSFSSSVVAHTCCSSMLQLVLHASRHLVHHHPNLHLRLRSTNRIAAAHKGIPVDTIADADPQAVL
jgi:hypothetical protein